MDILFEYIIAIFNTLALVILHYDYQILI